MSQNLIIDGNVFNGVDSITMTNDNGNKVTYVEKIIGEVVAKIGDTEFYTVEEALKGSVSGDTVLMVANSIENSSVTVPSEVTLDLNGFSLNVHGMSFI